MVALVLDCYAVKYWEEDSGSVEAARLRLKEWEGWKLYERARARGEAYLAGLLKLRAEADMAER